MPIYKLLIFLLIFATNSTSLSTNKELNEARQTSNFTLDSIDALQYPELAKFVKKYGCHLDEHDELAIEKSWSFLKTQESTHKKFYIKSSIHRLINAQRVKNCIKIHQLDRLEVAEKCIHCNNRSFVIIAKKISTTTNQPILSLIEVQQLTKLAEETCYWDWQINSGNVFRNHENKLVFIDTEDLSFCEHTALATETFQVLQHLHEYYRSMTPEAQTWFRAKMSESISLSSVIKPLPYNTKYDDPEIDFEQVKTELSIYYYSILFNQIKAFFGYCSE